MIVEGILDDVPIIIGGLGDFLEVRYGNANHKVLNRELSLIAEKLPRSAFVLAEGLTDKGDNLHFNSKSLYEFGLRYFEALESIGSEDTVTDDVSKDSGITFKEMELL